MIWLILTALITGFFGGYFLLQIESKDVLDVILMNSLNIIILAAGLEIGSNRRIVKKMMSWRTGALLLAVPCGGIAGSIIGGCLVGSLIGMPWREAALVSSGMGWYSLSSVVIAAMYSTELGTIAFLANALRELLAFVVVPVLARFTMLPCVAIGGASTMDSSLPVLLKYTNMQVGIIGFVNGVVISLVVPVLLSLLMP